jgi:hypothetical protein
MWMKQLIAVLCVCLLSVSQSQSSSVESGNPVMPPTKYGRGPSAEISPPVPLLKGDRIGWSADGNQHDSDDWGATAIALAVFAKAGLQDRMVHFDYGSWLPENTTEKYKENIESTLGGAQRFKFDRSKFFDDQTHMEEAIHNIAKEINASSAESRFWLCVAGPFEVAYQGIKAADSTKRKYCTLVSHSPGNEKRKGPWCHDREDCEYLGVEFIRIKGGNGLDSRFGGGNSHNWEDVTWLKESPDEDYRWVWQRIWAGGQGKPQAKRGALDASDACMAYWLTTGDEDGDFLKLKEMLGTGWKVSLAQDPVKIGIAGLSHSHVVPLLRNLVRDDIQIVGIAEKDTTLSKRYAERFGLDQNLIYQSLDETDKL